MDDTRHSIDLCPDCHGLRTVRMDRLHGVTGIRMTDDTGQVTVSTPAAIYIGPAPEPCPHPRTAGRG
ncbi:hypothetical protein ACFWVB_20075 [Streptomyces microflavus]|uniref:hypothetical protein n=1 Tax=Streptomyces microflavus TaxID=1919 RepID=UPI0036469A30